jgi:hypothetical protein
LGVKITKKNALIGLTIGIIIGLAAVAYSDSLSYTLTGLIIIPDDSVDVAVSGLPQNPDGSYELPTVTLSNPESQIDFKLRNDGSTDATLSFAVSAPAGLTVSATHQRSDVPGDPENWDSPFILRRGTLANIIVTLRDDGMAPGEHTFSIGIEAYN